MSYVLPKNGQKRCSKVAAYTHINQASAEYWGEHICFVKKQKKKNVPIWTETENKTVGISLQAF